ncbi:MAG: hypothetical protein A2Y50_09080 [Pseudomonadales bacterium RIFCSPLOWO2_12_59_9]|nr:MAG: hypothetical protein A2Y50_09080 [Pseudomonadales bacterium RIFCSPLOWO2_12_59_9]
MDYEKIRRENIRWHILVAANAGAPQPVAETLILSAIQSIPVECTALELRRQLDYLADRGLVELKRHEGAPWTADLTREGADVVEYTIECDPGIARPRKYW